MSGIASFTARPAQDVAGALFTWLAIAFDAGCAAPWQAPEVAPARAPAQAPPELRSSVHVMLARRAAWLEGATLRGDIDAPFTAALAAATTGSGADVSRVFALARAVVG
jgi:hypothetical protein